MAITKAQCELLPGASKFNGSVLAKRPGSSGLQGVRIGPWSTPFETHVIAPIYAAAGPSLAGTLEYWLRGDGSGTALIGPYVRGLSPFVFSNKLFLHYYGASTLEAVYALLPVFKLAFTPTIRDTGWLRRRVKYADIAPGAVRMRLEAYDPTLSVWVIQQQVTFAQAGNGYGVAGHCGFVALATTGYIDLDDVSHASASPTFPNDLYVAPVSEGFESASWRDNATLFTLSGSGEALALVVDNRPSSLGTSALELTYSSGPTLAYLRVPYMVQQDAASPDATQATIWVKMPAVFVATQRWTLYASWLGQSEKAYTLELEVDGSGNATVKVYNRRFVGLGSNVEAQVIDTVSAGTWVGLRLRVRAGSGQVAPKLYAAWANNSATFVDVNGAIEWTAQRVTTNVAAVVGFLNRIQLSQLGEGDTAIGESFTLSGCPNAANDGVYSITALAVGGNHSIVQISPSLVDSNIVGGTCEIDDVLHKSAPPLAGLLTASGLVAYRFDDFVVEQIP